MSITNNYMKLRNKILVMLSAILLSTLVALGVYATSAYRFSTLELSKTFKDFSTNSTRKDVIKQTKPFTILLMGVDTGSAERKSKWQGNSDSMILVTINPKTKRTTMTSLERDILTKLSGRPSNEMTGVEAKLNAAYAAGGAPMAIMTVQDLLHINVDKYVRINMQGLIDLVDAVGGITVTNKFDFPISIADHEPEYQATVQPGTHKINGHQALVYSRMRYDDPDGDYGRQQRQREVIQKVLKKVLALDSVSSYRKILLAVSNNMQTNIEISSRTIPSLLGYKDALNHIKTYQLKGEGVTLADGGSYQLVPEEHLLEVQNRIRKELGLSPRTSLKTNAITYEELYGGSRLKENSSSADVSVRSGISGTQSDTEGYYYPDASRYYGGAQSEAQEPAPRFSGGSSLADTPSEGADAGLAPSNAPSTTDAAPSSATDQSTAETAQ